jgi:hypothetical protein
MDLLQPDRTSDAEAEGLLARFRDLGVDGYPLDVFGLWLERDPSVVKRYALSSIAQLPTRVEACLANLATLHHYAATRFAAGVGFELRTAAAAGFSRAEVLEVLALAWLTDGPNTQRAVVEGGAELLRSWPEGDHERPAFPAGWAPDPEAFRSGLEPSLPPDLSEREHGLLRDWHLRTTGEVPASVAFMAEHRPALLKTHRLRWENTIRVLPKQVMPFVMLHSSATRGDAAGVRDAALLARAWGMTAEQVVWATTVGLSFGRGLEPLAVVHDAITDLLADWPDPTT